MACVKYGNFVIILITIHLIGLKQSSSQGQDSDHMAAWAKCWVFSELQRQLLETSATIIIMQYYKQGWPIAGMPTFTGQRPF